MNRIGILTSILAALTVFVWSAPVAAQQADFSISVPVELHALHPDVSGFFVICAIYADQELVGGGLGSSSEVTPVDADGNYLGAPVIVEINAPDAPTALNAAANNYTCGLRLVKTTGGTFRPVDGSTDEAGQPKAGTTFINESAGSFVQGG